jgi:DNA-binding MarR family transcriptional regulator
VTQDRDATGRSGADGTGAHDTRADDTRADDTSPGTEESLADAFWSVARQLRETSQDTLAPWDITPAQYRALRVLRRHGEMRLSALSDKLHIAARSTTEVIDALEARDLVGRQPDPQDRRATLVDLTEHGTSVLDAIRAARGTESERAFDRLTPADQAGLARILRQLRE